MSSPFPDDPDVQPANGPNTPYPERFIGSVFTVTSVYSPDDNPENNLWYLQVTAYPTNNMEPVTLMLNPGITMQLIHAATQMFMSMMGMTVTKIDKMDFPDTIPQEWMYEFPPPTDVDFPGDDMQDPEPPETWRDK